MASCDQKQEDINKYRHVCAICLETFKNPRQLPCSHGFCGLCLHGYLEKILTTRGAEHFPCPLCRRNIDVMTTDCSQIENIVEQFEVLSFSKFDHQTESRTKSVVFLCESCSRDDISNKAVKFCNECSEHICEECAAFHRKNKLLSTHTFSTLQREATPSRKYWRGPCSQHVTRQCEYVCTNHENAFCSRCIILQHRSCDVVSVEEYMTRPEHLKNIQLIQASLDELDRDMRHCQDSELEHIQYLDQVKALFEQEFHAAKNNLFQILNHDLDVYRFDSLALLEASKSETTAHKQMESDTNDRDLNNCHKILEGIQNGLVNPVITTKHLNGALRNMQVETEARARKLRKTTYSFNINVDSIKDIILKSVCFQSNEEYSFSRTIPCREKFVDITPRLMDGTILRERYIICTDETSKVLRLFDLDRNAEIQYIPLGINPFGIVKLSEDSVAVTFPNQKSIRIFKIMIKEVTFNVQSKLVRNINTENGMYGIRAYMIDRVKLGIITACKTTSTFYLYNTNGQQLKTIPIKFPEWRSPLRARSILGYANYFTVDINTGHIYIACTKWNCVLCFDFKGKPKFIHERPNSTLQSPLGISCGAQGEIFVCSYGNGQIQQLDKNGIFRETIPLKSLRAPIFLMFCSDLCVICDDNPGFELNVFKKHNL